MGEAVKTGPAGASTAPLQDRYWKLVELQGKPVTMLPGQEREVRITLASQQQRTAGDVRWIQEDLGHFYSRTQKEIHKDLMEAMRSSQIDSALVVLRQRIEKNQSFHSVHSSKKWAEQLREWAKKLEGDQKKDDANGSGDGDSPSAEDEDFEFMLKVMRMVQQEQDIRARTRSLEQLRRSLDLHQN